MKKKIFWIVVIGVLVRIFLAISTFHSDIQPFYFAGEVITKGYVLNFYDYLGNLPATDEILKIYPTNLFNYPPIVYFSLGPISYFLSLPFSRELLHNFIFNIPSLLGNPQFNLLLGVLKTSYIPFDIAIGLLLYSLFKEPKNKLLALGLWVFNPVNLFATYMMGQFDIIPAFLTVLALFLAVKKNKLLLPAFLLGLGASFKIFPVLFLIPLALLREKWVDRFKVTGIGIGAYILTILPFLGSSGFRSSALVAQQTTKSFYASLPISGGESIVIFPLLVIFFYLIFLYSRTTLENLWNRFFIMILLFFIFTHYHPQWFTWLTPFLIIDLVKSRLRHWPLVFVSLVSWLGLVTFFDPGLSTRLFAPIAPSLQGALGVWDSLGINFDLNASRSILHTIFVSAAVYYIYHYFPRETKA